MSKQLLRNCIANISYFEILSNKNIQHLDEFLNLLQLTGQICSFKNCFFHFPHDNEDLWIASLICNLKFSYFSHFQTEFLDFIILFSDAIPLNSLIHYIELCSV